MVYGLSIEVDGMDDIVILRLEGRLDALSCPQLEKKLQTLLEEKKYNLLMDFSLVDYLSSAALRLLLSYTKKTKALQGCFILFSLGEEVMEIVKMAGFETILTICSTEKQAMQKTKL